MAPKQHGLHLLMGNSNFTDLQVWQKSKILAINLFQANKSKNFSFNDQITRASFSISNNIAEGYGRFSNKEFIRYLNISKGSNDEVQSMILIGKELHFFDLEIADRLISQSIEINKMIIGLIKNLKSKS